MELLKKIYESPAVRKAALVLASAIGGVVAAHAGLI